MHFSFWEKSGFALLIAAWVVWGSNQIGNTLVHAEELAEKDQQITHLEDSGQAVSVLALQGQKRDLLVDHLKDLKDIAMQHDNALQKVCSARAVTLNVVGDTIRQALEECEETLGAFFAKIQEQKAVTHTRKKVL